MTTLRRVLRALLAGLAVLAAPVRAAEVVQLPTRPGVTQSYLLLGPAAPQAAVVLFAGGHGGLQLQPDGRLGWGGGNFLVRSRARFAAQGLAVAVVDAPSDRQQPPFLSGFRQTVEHAQDIQAVIADLRRRFGKPVVLVGTSRGTQSAAAIALALQGPEGPQALVLTSTILTDKPPGRAVPQMPLERLTVPVLVVHHALDACGHCQPRHLDGLLQQLRAPHKLLLYRDGQNEGDPCEARAYHGFLGIEDEVVGDVTAWIRGGIR